MTDSAPVTPRTEAGRALFRAIGDKLPENASLVDAILAIEREAAAPAATEALRSALDPLMDFIGRLDQVADGNLPLIQVTRMMWLDVVRPMLNDARAALASPEPTPKPDGWHTYHICDGLLRELTFVAGRAYCLVCDQWYPPTPATGLSAEALRAALSELIHATAACPDSLIGAKAESKVGIGGKSLADWWIDRCSPALRQARAALASPEPTPATGLSAETLRAEIRGMLADLLVTLDAPNPRLALQTGIEAIDYRLANFDYIAARTPSTDSPESGA